MVSTRSSISIHQHATGARAARRRVTTFASVEHAIAELTARDMRVSVQNIRWALADFRLGERVGSPNKILAILRVIRQLETAAGATPAESSPSRAAPRLLLVGSLCSGLDAPALALAQIGGWRTAWCAENDAEASALLARRHRARTVLEPAASLPNALIADSRVPNFGNILRQDFIELAKTATDDKRLDLIVGGSPCVSFSQAGLRKGLDDPDGQLAFRFLDICHRLNPRLVLWENVAAVQTDSQNAFGLFVANLAGQPQRMLTPDGLVPDVPEHRHGYAWADKRAGYLATATCVVAWRVFDARHMGTSQHRERILVLASGDPQVDPRRILFDEQPTDAPEPVPEGHPATVDQMILDEINQRIRGDADALPSLRETTVVVRAPFTLGSHGCYRPGVGTLRASGGDLGGGSETLLVPVEVRIVEPPTLDARGRLTGGRYEPVVVQPLRGLDILEGERLTGVPDGFTRVPTRKLSERWKRLGNSIALPMVAPVLRRVTTALQQPQASWRFEPWCTAERTEGDVRWALFTDTVRSADAVRIHGRPWQNKPVYTPLADVLVAEDSVANDTTVSAAGARGVVIRHLLRGKRVHPLLARGCVESVAHVLHEEECSEAARAAAAFAILRGCFPDAEIGKQAVQRLLPGAQPDMDLVTGIERILKPYPFRTTMGGKQVRQHIDTGIFEDTWDGIDDDRLWAVLGDPFLPARRDTGTSPAHLTAEAAVAFYAAAISPCDARFLAGRGDAWGPAMLSVAPQVVASDTAPQAKMSAASWVDQEARTVPAHPVAQLPASTDRAASDASRQCVDSVESMRQMHVLIQSLVDRHDLAAAALLADAQADVLHLWSGTARARAA